MARVQSRRIERTEARDRLDRERPGRAAVVDRRLARGVSVALVASLPVWAALAYALVV